MNSPDVDVYGLAGVGASPRGGGHRRSLVFRPSLLTALVPNHPRSAPSLILPFLEISHINGIMHYVASSVWLFHNAA